MSAMAWAVAAAGAAIAMGTAAADGALAAPECRHIAGSDDAHRALAMARVFAYLAVGAGIGRGVFRLGLAAPAQFAAIVALLALVLVTDASIRSAAGAHGLAVAAGMRPFTVLVSLVLRPVVRVGTAIEAALNRIIPARSDPRAEREATAVQLREVVEAEADVTRDEAALLHRAFALGQTTVEEIMVPRVDIVGVEVSTPWSEVLDRVRSSEHARLPAFRDTLDDIVGVLYAKDLLLWVLQGDEPPAGWESLVRAAAFIPGSKSIDRQLREFRKSGTHIAIVVDEFGGTAGLVTIEDVLEEIVGEIRDERDQEEPAVEREGNERFWVDGKVPLSELSDIVGAPLEREDVTTVGGLVYDAFGHVPHPGDSTTIGDFRVIVERVRRRRVERVYFERLSTAPPPMPEDS
ncbi:MAG TPA: hemolysin family protein [Gemmatimonadaceae bacterium]|nr:hemolysin family protein [Gemmatimonadaceae bacterium]